MGILVICSYRPHPGHEDEARALMQAHVPLLRQHGLITDRPVVQGVVITAVEGGSPAAEKNLKAGDVIVEVAGQSVKTPDDVSKKVEGDAKAGKKVELLLINRDGDLTYVGLRLG